MDNKHSNTFTLSRRIGSTNYRVNAHFTETASETMEDKLLRIIKDEAGANDRDCGIMVTPQMSRPA